MTNLLGETRIPTRLGPARAAILMAGIANGICATTFLLGCGAEEPPPVVNDADQDGIEDASDCNANDPEVYPGATEVCDKKDNNCNAQVDEAPGNDQVWYHDKDSDGYGSYADTIRTCSAPPDYLATAGDCDDLDSSVYPSAVEVFDGTDSDCNGWIDDGPAFYVGLRCDTTDNTLQMHLVVDNRCNNMMLTFTDDNVEATLFRTSELQGTFHLLAQSLSISPDRPTCERFEVTLQDQGSASLVSCEALADNALSFSFCGTDELTSERYCYAGGASPASACPTCPPASMLTALEMLNGW